MVREFTYYNNCVNWPHKDVDGLSDMIDAARDITRKTFLKHVNARSRGDIEGMLGYAPHDPRAVLTMARDWAVSYHKSKLHGKTVYFFVQSAIEYVFTKGSVNYV